MFSGAWLSSVRDTYSIIRPSRATSCSSRTAGLLASNLSTKVNTVVFLYHHFRWFCDTGHLENPSRPPREPAATGYRSLSYELAAAGGVFCLISSLKVSLVCLALWLRWNPEALNSFVSIAWQRTHCFLFFLRTPSYSDEFLPSHPCLRLVANSEQGLSRHVSRRLITMEKIKEHAVRGPSKIHRK